MNSVERIVKEGISGSEDLKYLLQVTGDEQKKLFTTANAIKNSLFGNKVFFRGLVEFSNICTKDCLYCGIRRSNTLVDRYNLSDDEIVDAAIYAWEQKYASMVLQSGEISSPGFSQRITDLLTKIHSATHNELRITLSLGEQSPETYKQWFEAGAHRYLLRIESSNEALYRKIHPNNENHSFEKRLKALESLKQIGYQTGTGVMIGLPFQTLDDLVGDLLFMKNNAVDMVGMGPYIEHRETPLYANRDELMPLTERFSLTLRMIATLRILMPKINIAAATALQAIDKMGREKAVLAGANIIMPNITPGMYRDSYKLYDNKPCTDENADECTNCLTARVAMTGSEIAFGDWGDSQFFQNRSEI